MDLDSRSIPSAGPTGILLRIVHEQYPEGLAPGQRLQRILEPLRIS